MGDTSWISLSKTSGQANAPMGEWVKIQCTENENLLQRSGYIDVVSGGKTISVAITQLSGAGQTFNLVNLGNNLVNLSNNLVSRQ